MGDSQQREKHRPGGLAVAEVSPALAEGVWTRLGGCL